ncbi:MAG: DNA methyltransferase [Thermoproteota archaeon]|nr:DNA methyltransferase [Thermoproteota archaeon]
MEVENKLEKEKKTYRPMELVTFEDFQKFIAERKAVTIEKVNVKVGNEWKIKKHAPPKEYAKENTTVWSFPNRGNWATHKGNYRGNWSPYIPRNLILRYTNPNDMVLDQMVGSGTTLVECKLLGRNGIGVDINRDATMVTLDRLNFAYNSLDPNYPKNLEIATYVGDARNLEKIESNSIDLIATHPPYAGIITYTKKRVEGDLSSLKFKDYLKEMRVVAQESLRVLKHGKHCAILIGDTRKHLHYIPISKKILEVFLDVGFILREDVIKLQWKTKTTRERWRGKSYKFLKIAHEHLYIFRKPLEEEKTSRLKYSSKWLNKQV